MTDSGSGMRRARSSVTIREMSSAGRHIIEEFGALADSEKREVLMRLSRDLARTGGAVCF
jgi:hypothetical protein